MTPAVACVLAALILALSPDWLFWRGGWRWMLLFALAALVVPR